MNHGHNYKGLLRAVNPGDGQNADEGAIPRRFLP